MNDSVLALRAAFEELLAKTPCIGRQPPEPVAMMAVTCERPDCPSCRGRSALRAYELGEADRFRARLSERARLDVADQMVEELGAFGDLLVLLTKTVTPRYQGLEETCARVQDVLSAYRDAKALGAAKPA
jgi:hypothetical protein